MPNIVAKPNQGAPFSVPAGSSNLDTETASSGLVSCKFEIAINGNTAQIAADWATLLATSLSSPSAIISFQS